MIFIKILILVLIIFVFLYLLYPLLKEEKLLVEKKVFSKQQELEIEKSYLEQQLMELTLDKDSGKILEEEWSSVIKPIEQKIKEIEVKLKGDKQ